MVPTCGRLKSLREKKGPAERNATDWSMLSRNKLRPAIKTRKVESKGRNDLGKIEIQGRGIKQRGPAMRDSHDRRGNEPTV